MNGALHIDFETRGVLDLKKVGLHRYARDPNTDVWCMAWAQDDRDPDLWDGSAETSPFEAWDHVKDGGPVYAWNASFELEIWNEIMVKRYGWPPLRPEQTFCTMAQSYAMGFPGALDVAAPALGVDVRKDAEGHALMLRMCRPRSKKGAPLVWWDEPEKLARLYEYCKQDVRTERAVGERLLPLSDRERRVWLLDYKINQQGVQVDIESARAAVAMAEAVKADCNAQIAALTAGAVKSITKVADLKRWMASRGVEVDSLAKQAVVDLLAVAEPEADEDLAELAEAEVPAELPADVRQALLLRQEAGKASTAKFDVMLDVAGADGRVRGMYQYHGTSTGRWAGRKVQTHNLPRKMPKPETVEKILALVRRGDWRAIDMIYGPPLTMLSQCLRSFFVSPPGAKIISGDFSNVESRGGAWFAGEDWKLKAFLEQDAGTGPDVYKLGASRLLGIPVADVTDEQRQAYGKVPDLAFMYQGGVGSGKIMGKTYGVKATDEEWNHRKELWRDNHPAIAGARNEKGYRRGGAWYAVQTAAISAVMNEGEAFTCGVPGRHATYKMVGSCLWCLLPSGRAICYPYPKLLEGDYGPQLTYMCVPSPEDKKKGKVIFDDANMSRWVRIGTYGGSLFNHINQGFCRDFLADLLLWLDDNGALIVLHTHDDANIEVLAAKAEGARKAMQDRMRRPPDWAEGFPLFAKCDVMERYGK